MEKSLT